jgi:hypothetical protein
MPGVEYRVTHPEAPRLAADHGIGEIADHVKEDCAARSPVDTGRLQASWEVAGHGEPGFREVINTAPYARFVEYGTRYDQAQPMVGPVVAEYRGGP